MKVRRYSPLRRVLTQFAEEAMGFIVIVWFGELLYGIAWMVVKALAGD